MYVYIYSIKCILRSLIHPRSLLLLHAPFLAATRRLAPWQRAHGGSPPVSCVQGAAPPDDPDAPAGSPHDARRGSDETGAATADSGDLRRCSQGSGAAGAGAPAVGGELRIDVSRTSAVAAACATALDSAGSSPYIVTFRPAACAWRLFRMCAQKCTLRMSVFVCA
jgi:hypothetical protein